MLTLYRPLSNLLRDEFFGDHGFEPWGYAPTARARSEGFSPAVDIVENENAYLVKAEIPGIAAENIDIQVEDDVLTVRGERKNEHEETRGGYRRVERSYGSFARSFALPKGTKVDAIEAQIDSGVLTVTIPKPVASTARKVEVKGASLVDKAKKLFAKTPDNSTPNHPTPNPQA